MHAEVVNLHKVVYNPECFLGPCFQINARPDLFLVIFSNRIHFKIARGPKKERFGDTCVSVERHLPSAL